MAERGRFQKILDAEAARLGPVIPVQVIPADVPDPDDFTPPPNAPTEHDVARERAAGANVVARVRAAHAPPGEAGMRERRPYNPPRMPAAAPAPAAKPSWWGRLKAWLGAA